MADFVKVAKTDEVEPGQARLVAVKGREIALFNIDVQFFALANACTRNGALAQGEIWDRDVTCPVHGATFDIRRGEVLTPSAYEVVATHRVRVTGTHIEVEV